MAGVKSLIGTRDPRGDLQLYEGVGTKISETDGKALKSLRIFLECDRLIATKELKGPQLDELDNMHASLQKALSGDTDERILTGVKRLDEQGRSVIAGAIKGLRSGKLDYLEYTTKASIIAKDTKFLPDIQFQDKPIMNLVLYAATRQV